MPRPKMPTQDELAGMLGSTEPKTMVRSLLKQHKSGNISATRTLLFLYVNSNLNKDKDHTDTKSKARLRLYSDDEGFEFALQTALGNISWCKVVNDLKQQAKNGNPAAVELLIELLSMLNNMEED